MLDESYKIRIGPRGSSSPHPSSPTSDEMKLEDVGEAEDLSVRLSAHLDEPMDQDKKLFPTDGELHERSFQWWLYIYMFFGLVYNDWFI